MKNFIERSRRQVAQLVEPNPAIKYLSAQRQARLVSTFLLTLIPIAFTVSLWLFFQNGPRNMVFNGIVFFLLVLIGSYRLSRTVYYNAAARITVAFFGLLSFILSLNGLQQFNTTSPLLWLIPIIVLCSFLLHWRATIIAAVAICTAIFVIGNQVQFTEPAGVSRLVGIAIFTSALLIIAAAARHRDQIHIQNLANQLQQSNADLEAKITARTKDLADVNLELAQAVKLKDTFMATMSHELRTPLTSILARSEALRKTVYGPVSQKQRGVLDGLETSGHHLLELIEDILDVSKISSGKLEINPSVINVHEVCSAVFTTVRPDADRKNIAATMQLDDAVVFLHADDWRLKQILGNLLENAIKFTPEGGRIGLSLKANSEKQSAEFTVWDTGIGFDHADKDHIFKPFVQLEDGLNRSFEGSGLGLALVKQLTQLHGGSIVAESKPGSGSIFIVSLPWYSAESDPLPPEIDEPASDTEPVLSY